MLLIRISGTVRWEQRVINLHPGVVRRYLKDLDQLPIIISGVNIRSGCGTEKEGTGNHRSI